MVPWWGLVLLVVLYLGALLLVFAVGYHMGYRDRSSRRK